MRFEQINKMGAPCFCFIPSVPFEIPHPPSTTISKEKQKTKLGPPVEIPAYPIVHQSDINLPGPLEMFFPFYPEAPQIFHTDVSRVSQNQQLTTCRVFYPPPPKRKMNQQIFGRKRSTRDTHTRQIFWA
jgi:hypothetical protein